MSPYETLSEKLVVVIDIGAAYTKYIKKNTYKNFSC